MVIESRNQRQIGEISLLGYSLSRAMEAFILDQKSAEFHFDFIGKPKLKRA